MLRFVINSLGQKWLKLSSRPTLQYRYMSDKTEIVIGGGLEKPQGGLNEEKYFYKQNSDLMAKIGKVGTKFKCENYVSDWNQFEKVLSASDDRTALRETCSLNKNKNCLEEAFFLTEQNECCLKLRKENNFIKEETNFEASIENKEKS